MSRNEDDRSVAVASYHELQALFPEVAEDPADYIRAFVHFDRHLDALLNGLDLDRQGIAILQVLGVCFLRQGDWGDEREKEKTAN